MHFNSVIFNVFRAVAFGILYAIFEATIPFYKYMSVLEYRAFYFAVFFVTMSTRNVRMWFANFFASMTVEDISYWVIKHQLPFQYTWYYPVIYHIPLVDVIEGVIAVVLYLKNKE